MDQVKRTQRGVDLTIIAESSAAPLTKRIGSCALRFQDGSRELVRIYGHMPDIWTRPERVEFEKELRNLCAEEEVIKTLFPNKALLDVRRFNPSEWLITKGWRVSNSQVHAVS